MDKVIARIEAQSPGMPKKQVYDIATQEFFNEANAAIRLKQHFTLETNFRNNELVDIAAQFKRYGYTTNMVYLALKSVEQSTVRVNKRVLDGGHFVDRRNILLNYNEGLQYLERYAGRFDNLAIIDASKGIGEFELKLKIKQQQLVHISKDLPASIKQTVTGIAGRFKDNSRDGDNDEGQGLDYRLGR